ncbi:MAG: RluA family pseudouridine synthase [Sandaracinaceae bacterium]
MTQPVLLSRANGLWAVNKPSGWTAHPQGDPGIDDVLTWAREVLSAPASIAPVHRLDRATSGVLLLSPDASVRAAIGGELAEGRVHKHYRALVYGRANKKGIVRRPIRDRRRGASVPAVTRFTRLAAFKSVSLLAVRPETGRRHQIRVHLSGIGHALVGDERYPPRRRRSVPGFPGRLWLHALRLELPDGTTFEAPLPEALEHHLTLLGERASTTRAAPQ